MGKIQDMKQAAALGQEILKQGCLPGAGKQVSGEDLLNFIGPMIDGMIKEVPLDKFEEIKKANPKAPIVPIMEFEQIKHNEAKMILELLGFFGEDLPIKVKKPVFKLGFGIAYKADNNDEYRKQWTNLMDKITDMNLKEKFGFGLEHIEEYKNEIKDMEL